MAAFGVGGRIVSGEWNPKGFGGLLSIAAGLTGELVIITDPGGADVKLKNLSAASSASQDDISIIVDGVTIVDQMILSDVSPTGALANAFFISEAYGTAADIRAGNQILTAPFGKEIKIVKTGINTTEAINYSVEKGEQ